MRERARDVPEEQHPGRIGWQLTGIDESLRDALMIRRGRADDDRDGDILAGNEPVTGDPVR